MGIAMMCKTLSKLLAFFFSAGIIEKLGTVKVLLVSIAAYATRITYYANGLARAVGTLISGYFYENYAVRTT
uniref:Uncharacterized protein n=1 Tax=Globisporangium ultimum (strain ATCC 200006 / CBS 805.95 / DAOM BR144) TaxID=431595 RepID=K3WZ25_GLOUD